MTGSASALPPCVPVLPGLANARTGTACHAPAASIPAHHADTIP